MPNQGQILVNPQTGDSIEFLETSVSSNGARVRIKVRSRRSGPVVPNHFHALQDETFEVESGKLTIWTRKNSFVIGPGEKIRLPKNQAHNHFNKEGEELVYIQTVEPALDFDYLIENIVGLTVDGKSKNGKFGLMQELVSLRYLDSKTYLAALPLGVQKVLMHTVAPVGRMLGYRAIYNKYSGIEK